MATEVIWFKRDLRLRDHPPLLQAIDSAALSGQSLLPLFFVEPERLKQPDTSEIHLHWELDCARALDRELQRRGSRLWILHADPLEVFRHLHETVELTALHSHEETGTDWSFQRDRVVQKWCRKVGVDWHETPSNGVVRRLKGRDAWKSARDRRMRQALADAPEFIPAPPEIPSLDRWSCPDLSSLGFPERPLRDRPDPGESSAQDVLNGFLEERGEPYRYAMSSPLSGSYHCSRLAPYLALGCLSLRRVVQQTQQREKQLKSLRQEGRDTKRWLPSLSSFKSRLAWHCHFMQKLEMEPDLDVVAQNPIIDARMPRPLVEDKFQAWSTGNTGWPFLDACMRQLHATGWINFRMRAMLMSVASYTLWLPWRETGLHLARLFLDYEPGIHWSQVGMQSGTTGINTVRAYSVTKQGRDQDPEGTYIRRWVPELVDVPAESIHEPWKMDEGEQERCQCRIGLDYPAPLVEEGKARKEGVSKTYAARRDPEARKKSQEVFQKHGSRKGPTRRRKPAKKSPKEPAADQPGLFKE